MKVLRHLVVVVEHNKPDLGIGTPELPLGVVRQLVKEQGTLIWDWEGQKVVVDPSLLANALSVYEDWEQGARKVATPRDAATLAWAHEGQYAGVPVARLLTGLQE